MEILTSVKRIYTRFKSLVNDFVYSFGRAALLLLVAANPLDLQPVYQATFKHTVVSFHRSRQILVSAGPLQILVPGPALHFISLTRCRARFT